jgi:hypothetical protein
MTLTTAEDALWVLVVKIGVAGERSLPKTLSLRFLRAGTLGLWHERMVRRGVGTVCQSGRQGK